MVPWGVGNGCRVPGQDCWMPGQEAHTCVRVWVGWGVGRVRPLESQTGAGWTAEMQWSLLRGDQGGIHFRKWVSVPGSGNHGDDSVWGGWGWIMVPGDRVGCLAGESTPSSWLLSSLDPQPSTIILFPTRVLGWFSWGPCSFKSCHKSCACLWASFLDFLDSSLSLRRRVYMCTRVCVCVCVS